MARTVILFCICVVVVALDVVAGILGHKAEAAQDNKKHLTIIVFECKKPSHDAYVLGFTAAVLFVVAHLLANFLGGCRTAGKLSSLCLVVIWITMVVGLSLLVLGTKSNQDSGTKCGLSRDNFLSRGGMACFVHAGCSVVYFILSVFGNLI